MQLNDVSSYKFKGLQLAFVQLVFLLLAFSLLIDSITGFLMVGMGLDLKLSSVYKILMLAIVLCIIGTLSRKHLANILLLLLALLVGSTSTLIQTADVKGFIDDFITVLKLLMPLIIFVFCVLVAQRRAALVTKYGAIACYVSFVILAVNLALGAMGFGFSSYGANDIGVKGFFYAGNEVGGLFIIFYGVILHYVWQKNSFILYALMSLIALVSGLLIATKAAMLAAILLVFLIPVFNDRNRILNLTKLKLNLIVPIILAAIVLSFFLVSILETTGIWNRLVWFYQKKGLIGLFLSGREVYVVDALVAFEQIATIPQYIFGIGQSGLGILTYNMVEVDPLDMFFWYGCIGAFTYIFIITVFLRTSYLATRLPESSWGPAVFLINILLIAVSFIAGHIFTSGMLGPFIGLVNGMAYVEIHNKKVIGV